jgi:hypothetical protein
VAQKKKQVTASSVSISDVHEARQAYRTKLLELAQTPATGSPEDVQQAAKLLAEATAAKAHWLRLRALKGGN